MRMLNNSPLTTFPSVWYPTGHVLHLRRTRHRITTQPVDVDHKQSSVEACSLKDSCISTFRLMLQRVQHWSPGHALRWRRFPPRAGAPVMSGGKALFRPLMARPLATVLSRGVASPLCFLQKPSRKTRVEGLVQRHQRHVSLINQRGSHWSSLTAHV